MIGGWLKRRREAKFAAMLQEAAKNPDSPAGRMIAQRAIPVAQQSAMLYIMQWLDKKRINHCGFCHATDQLRKHEQGYLVCPPHVAFSRKDGKVVVGAA